MEFVDDVIEELILKICCSAVEDLWSVISVDGHIPESEVRNYLNQNTNYEVLREILNMTK